MLCTMARMALALAVVPAFVGSPTVAQQEPPHIEFGALAITGYELREVRFDPPRRTFKKDGTPELHSYGWQIVIKGTDFPRRALDPFLWVDDVVLRDYERSEVVGEQSLAYNVFDPTLFRSEHVLQVIYGNDERTRTKLLERMDPERLVRLPDDQRKALGMPELEGVTLTQVDAAGRIAGRGRVSGGAVRLAARTKDGMVALLAKTVAMAPDGSFAVDAGPLPKETTHVYALLVPAGVEFTTADATKLPKGVELLDAKPVGTKAAR